MATTQAIPTVRLAAGQRTFNFTNTLQPWSTAAVVIDRTGPSGLNALTNADTLVLEIQYSSDGGATWQDIGGVTLHGGTVTAKGSTVDQSGFSVGIGVPFATGTGFRVLTTASTPVTISGSVIYDTP